MADSKKPRRENAVLFHHPDAVETGREVLLGRHAAGEGFLRGFVRHSGVERFYCQSLEDAHVEDFARHLKSFGATDQKCVSVPIGKLGQGAEVPTTLMVPSPDISLYAWRRRISAHSRSYSLCGLNHTIASDTAMDGLGQLLTAPVQPWDAVVCTSNAAKATIRRLLDNWSDYLSRRSGGRFRPEVQMPVIPLGVDSERYAASAVADDARVTIRRGLGIGDEDIAVLYFGRLSFHAKAHPLPMYLGLEETTRRTGKRIHLLQVGRFPNDGVEKEFRDAARRYCPNVKVIFLDGRDQAVSDRVWFAADIFTSLSDNIQESFGLTPIEAMAAGLPVVVSDWDGYRDTVRHGTDGFLIPTWLPLPDSGSDLSLQMEASLTDEARDRSFNQYCGIVSQSMAVDVAAAADAYAALAIDPALRKRLGEAARKRAREVYDWRVVINAYQDLWRELANIRSRSVESAPTVAGRPMHPLRDDPFSLFQAYPSQTVNGDALVAIAKPEAGELLEQLAERRALMMNQFAEAAMLSDEDITCIGQELAEKGTCSVIELAEPLGEGVRFRLPRTLAWLAKLGLVTLSPAGQAGKSAPAGPAAGKTEAQSLVNLGLSARSRGAYDAAAEYFEKALKADPDHVEANYSFGELLAAAQKLPEAAVCLRRAAARDSSHVGARRSLGKVLFLLGDERAALQALEEAAERAPSDVETRYLLGAGYRRAGAANNAIPHLQAALKINPQRSDALTHLALARKSLGRTDEARHAIDQALEVDPTNVFARAAYLSFKAEKSGRRNISQSKTARRVGIHINRRFHFPLLRPLFDALLPDHWPLITGDGRELIEFDPDVVVVCDGQAEVLRTSLPKAIYVQTRNSLASKNYLANLPKPGDFICMPSPGFSKQFSEKTGVKTERLWVTGYIGNDALFRKQSSPLPFDLPLDKKVVLYAPTATPSMTTVHMLAENIGTLILGERRDICLLIKPHPDFCEQSSALRTAWKNLAETNENIFLLDDPEADLTAAMLASDVLVSDASGVIFQYLILDRPIVLLANPEKSKDPLYFDADGPERSWRDLGFDITDVDKLAAAVLQSLANPNPHGDRRAYYRDLLYGNLTDGDAAQRIVQKISEIAN
ncbi:MAG: CDP-glycerol glycerophosphotransferase family protein [Rhodospirillales bacterium]|nr:CDP-glycerol glycerophosphotransferase family protein [Rhodospirillales bacterium]